MTTPKDFVLLEPLLTESLQEYLARHGLRPGIGEAPAAIRRWREGPAWVAGVTDWRTREQRRQDELRQARGYAPDPYHTETP